MDEKIDRTIDILSKPLSDRSPAETLEVIAVLSTIEFFQTLVSEMGESTLKECYKVLQLKHYEPEDTIVNYNEVGNNCFIIIKGRVSVSVPTITTNELEEEEEILMPVAELGRGVSFGEKSLITEMKRNATVECLTATTVLVIMKKNYDSLLKKHQKAKHDQRMEFLSHIDIFKSWTKKKLSKLTDFFKVCSYQKHQIVYKEGQTCGFVYVVRSGEFKFTRTHKVVIDTPLSETGFLTIQANPKSYKRIRDLHKYTRNRKLQISIKLKHEMFGYEEIISKNQSRVFTCECVSPKGELLAISVDEFKKRILHHESLNFLRRKYRILDEWIQERIEKLKTIEISKVSTQFSVSAATNYNKNDRFSNYSLKRCFREVRCLPTHKTNAAVNSTRNQSAKFFKRRIKKEFNFNLFNTEVPAIKNATHKEPSISQIRNIMTDFKPKKLAFIRYSSAKAVRNKQNNYSFF